MLKYTLAREGKVYRGNLHAHSSITDGNDTPEHLIERYKNQGYDFLAITDHRIYIDLKGYDTDNFLMIPGTELHTLDGRHHIIGIANDCNDTGFDHLYDFNVDPDSLKDPQSMIDLLTAHNNFTIYCHPYWSHVDISEILSLKGLTAMEIMNYSAEHYWMAGESAVFFDHYWWEEKPLWGVSTDDTHTVDHDSFGGYIRVKTTDFSKNGIINAVKAGSFYACYSRQGKNDAPEILDFVVEDGIAKFTCSPCQDLCFHSMRTNIPYHGTEENPVTYGEFKVPENAFCVLACCKDFKGNTSWAQPIQLRQPENCK